MESFLLYWGVGIVFLCITSSLNCDKGYRLKVIDVIFVLIGALLWPFLVAVLIFSKGTPQSPITEAKFEVLNEDLTERLTISEIEKQHYVFDPLESVPEKPFGFLNNAWATFCYSDNEVSFWSFEKEDPTSWIPEIKKGYAKLNSENEVVDWFVYEVEEISN